MTIHLAYLIYLWGLFPYWLFSFIVFLREDISMDKFWTPLWKAIWAALLWPLALIVVPYYCFIELYD
jgi:hypothetical protein